ncbi:MAG: hypothetical protein HWN68_17295 [Desulfobacterales bacterium]|nr:hypothetical protein [Desulfobacterales bacterium]
MSLNEHCVEALRRIGEIVFPDSISWKAVTKHLRGYDKERAIEQMIEGAKRDPLLTRLKLFCVFTELERLKNNGGLLSE